MKSEHPAAVSTDPDRGTVDGGRTQHHVGRQHDALAQLSDREVFDRDRFRGRGFEDLADGSSGPHSAAPAELDEVVGDQRQHLRRIRDGWGAYEEPQTPVATTATVVASAVDETL